MQSRKSLLSSLFEDEDDYVVRSSECFLCATGSSFQFMAGETAKGTASV